MKSPDPLRHELDARSFLERLRARLLRVTAGMRGGPQRLELAIETFWYAAQEVQPAAGPVMWRMLAAEDHPLRHLLTPVRLMVRSELMSSGLSRPDVLTDAALEQLLGVAQAEALSRRTERATREQFFDWLRAAMRGALRELEQAGVNRAA